MPAHAPEKGLGLCLSRTSIKSAQGGAGCLLYCRLVRCLVPTSSRTPEFSSSPPQGGSHPEAVQLNRSIGERVRGRYAWHESSPSRARFAGRRVWHGQLSQLKITLEHS